ncbi:MAG TPA: sigma-54 dependent transcriptional regulator [Thermoanaerobaculia bacterium]|nr:sigma-54 dependent transcriptional regulator [Thermoanaerobaculia bacterium]
MSAAKHRVLLVDAQASVRVALGNVLKADNYDVEETESLQAARERFRACRPDAVVVASRLPDGTALDLLSEVKAADPGTGCLVLAEPGDLEIAARALLEGAEQFLVKPVDRLALLFVLQRVLENQRNRRLVLRDASLQTRELLDPFLGDSPAIHALAEQARRVVFVERPVLIRGETGTGKGVLAAWLHRNGPRSEECFLDLNCAGLSREFLETELFGHEKGAFTGAVATKVGLLEVADRGTLFLDEIGDVDPQVQPKLLKVLEEKRFRRLGDVRDRQVDVWLIAATHQNLARLVEQKKFRSDLYYRISTILLQLPPLRDRIQDIPVLAEHFLRRISSELGRSAVSLSDAALGRLQAHSWPGNIRELRNVLERAALSGGKSVIEPEDLGFDLERRTTREDVSPALTLREAEKRLIERTLREERGQVERAAQRLGISRSSLYQRIQRHGIVVSRI